MSKAFVIILSTPFPFRDEIIKYLEEKKSIDTWEYCLPYSIFIKSPLSSKEISSLLREKYGDLNHLIIGVDSDYYGLLPENYWNIFY